MRTSTSGIICGAATFVLAVFLSLAITPLRYSSAAASEPDEAAPQPKAGGEEGVDLVICKLDGTEIGEDVEEDPGIAFLWNADNDDGGTKLDKDDPEGTYDKENDLHKLILKVIPPDLKMGTVKLEQLFVGGNHGSVKVWTQNTKVKEVSLPVTWDLSKEEFPKTLWVEGVTGADNVRDVELKLTYVQTGKSDSVRITVVPLIPIAAPVEGEDRLSLQGAAWKPDGSYCLLPGMGIIGGSSAYKVARYSYPQVAPTLLTPDDNMTGTYEAAWNPDRSFAITCGTNQILKYTEPNTWTKIYEEHPPEPGRRIFYDVKWKPGGGYAVCVGESPGFVVKCDGVNVENISPPNSHDIYCLAWQPNGNQLICFGDSGLPGDPKHACWKWSEAGGWAQLAQIESSGVGCGWKPDGSYALVGCTAGKIYRCDPDGRLTRILDKGGNSQYTAICWNRNEKYAVVAGPSGWDPLARQVSVFDGAKFYEVDVWPNDPAIHRSAWCPGQSFCVGGCSKMF